MQKNYPGSTRPLISRNKREGRYAGKVNATHFRSSEQILKKFLPLACVARITSLDREIYSGLIALDKF